MYGLVLPIVQPDNRRGSLIPRKPHDFGGDATQSASRVGCNVRYDDFGRMAKACKFVTYFVARPSTTCGE